MKFSKDEKEFLAFIYDKNEKYDYIDESICEHAARFGFLNVFKYLYKLGYKFSLNIKSIAIENDNAHILIFLNTHKCSLHMDYEIGYAVRCGSLNCISYMCEHDYPVTPNLYFMMDKNANIECLKLLHYYHCPLSMNVSIYAAKCGRIDWLEYLNIYGYVPNEQTCLSAIQNGHINCLSYLLYNGCPYNEEISSLIFNRGYQECFKYINK
jgi:hypothetical protein